MAEVLAQLSAEWRALLDSSTVDFKGPPGEDRIAEIAYGTAPEHQGKGYATEAAAALVAFAFKSGIVRMVRAHTKAESNASTRVLTKCGFLPVGTVLDPEDGVVWRWQIALRGDPE